MHCTTPLNETKNVLPTSRILNVSALPEWHLQRWVAAMFPASAKCLSRLRGSCPKTNHTVSDSSLASLLPSWFSPQHPRMIGRCSHEFPHASDYSTCCWACIVVPMRQCTGTQTHQLSKQQTHSPNPSVDVPPRIRTGLPIDSYLIGHFRQ